MYFYFVNINVGYVFDKFYNIIDGVVFMEVLGFILLLNGMIFIFSLYLFDEWLYVGDVFGMCIIIDGLIWVLCLVGVVLIVKMVFGYIVIRDIILEIFVFIDGEVWI